MRLMIRTNYLSAEEKNNLYALGYRYYCDGNYRTLSTTDPWSGMPNTDNDTFAFDNKKEAEAFAKAQIWVFNPDSHATVHAIPEHTETWEERDLRYAREKAEKAAKKAAKEAKKAASMGMTVEEMKRAESRKRLKRKLENEIAELEEALADKKKKLANL